MTRARRFGVAVMAMAAVLFWLFTPAWAVEVTTRATTQGAGEAGKNAAAQLALRKVCQEVCAEFLKSQEHVPDRDQILDAVMVDTSAFVSAWRITSAEEAEGAWTVEVAADVSPEAFARAWKQAYLRTAAPQLMVTLTELRDGQKQEVSIVAAGIARYLLRQGFRLVDKAQFDAVKEARLKEAALSDDLALAASIARDIGADLLVVGEVRADKGREIDVEGVKFQSYTAQASVKVVQADSGVQVVSERASGAGASQDPNTAATKALEQCTGKIAALVWRGCLDNFDRMVPKTFHCQLRVTDITAQGALTLETKLRSVEGVTSVTLREVRAGTAQYDIVTPHNARDLFAILVGSAELGKLVEVTGITNKIIHARWKEAEF